MTNRARESRDGVRRLDFWPRYGNKLARLATCAIIGHQIFVSCGGTMAQIVNDCGGRLVAFDFKGEVDGVPYESVVSPHAQELFIKAFGVEIAKIEKWFVHQRWLASVTAQPALGTYAPQQLFELNDVDLRVSVSQAYPISRSLVPSSIGQRGMMEFPAREAAPKITAAIMHELAHTYFPNGNRFVDEGFAVYLQNKIGSNPAFPDFQQDLHDLMVKLACKIDSDINSNPNPTPLGGLANISVVALERVATPAPLELQLTSNISVGGPHGIAAGVQPGKPAYVGLVVAGSFVRFLIDSFGLDTFHELYRLTPLKPLHRDAGKPDRWRHVKGYKGLSVGDLEKKWKSMIAASPCVKDAAPGRKKAV